MPRVTMRLQHLMRRGTDIRGLLVLASLLVASGCTEKTQFESTSSEQHGSPASTVGRTAEPDDRGNSSGPEQSEVPVKKRYRRLDVDSLPEPERTRIRYLGQYALQRAITSPYPDRKWKPSRFVLKAGPYTKPDLKQIFGIPAEVVSEEDWKLAVADKNRKFICAELNVYFTLRDDRVHFSASCFGSFAEGNGLSIIYPYTERNGTLEPEDPSVGVLCW